LSTTSSSTTELHVLMLKQMDTAVCDRKLTSQVAIKQWSALAVMVASQHSRLDLRALCALEVALSLVQAQASESVPPSVCLLTMGAHLSLDRVSKPHHAGSWGLARSARAEAQLPVACFLWLAAPDGPRRPLPDPDTHPPDGTEM